MVSVRVCVVCMRSVYAWCLCVYVWCVCVLYGARVCVWVVCMRGVCVSACGVCLRARVSLDVVRLRYVCVCLMDGVDHRRLQAHGHS